MAVCHLAVSCHDKVFVKEICKKEILQPVQNDKKRHVTLIRTTVSREQKVRRDKIDK